MSEKFSFSCRSQSMSLFKLRLFVSITVTVMMTAAVMMTCMMVLPGVVMMMMAVTSYIEVAFFKSCMFLFPNFVYFFLCHNLSAVLSYECLCLRLQGTNICSTLQISFF